MIGPTSKTVAIGCYVIGIAVGVTIALIIAKVSDAPWLFALAVPFTIGIATILMRVLNVKTSGTKDWFKTSSGR
jgi:thiol:disulfide interchange protein